MPSSIYDAMLVERPHSRVVASTAIPTNLGLPGLRLARPLSVIGSASRHQLDVKERSDAHVRISSENRPVSHGSGDRCFVSTQQPPTSLWPRAIPVQE
jgi:hypothetical protein